MLVCAFLPNDICDTFTGGESSFICLIFYEKFSLVKDFVVAKNQHKIRSFIKLS